MLCTGELANLGQYKESRLSNNNLYKFFLITKVDADYWSNIPVVQAIFLNTIPCG